MTRSPCACLLVYSRRSKLAVFARLDLTAVPATIASTRRGSLYQNEKLHGRKNRSFSRHAPHTNRHRQTAPRTPQWIPAAIVLARYLVARGSSLSSLPLLRASWSTRSATPPSRPGSRRCRLFGSPCKARRYDRPQQVPSHRLTRFWNVGPMSTMLVT